MTAHRFTTSRRNVLLAAGGLAMVPAMARAQTPAATPPVPTANSDISGEINVGMVGNPQMTALQEMVNAGYFNQAYPNITVNLTVLPENEIRTSINQDVAAQGGAYDAVTISNFEVPIWAANDWLTELGEAARADESYNFDDILPAHLQGLTYEEGVYALPFYGESAMLYYRTDVLEELGITLPEDPTWTQLGEIATQIKTERAGSDGMSGIALRGLIGWGQQLAPMTTVINAFGGSWYDADWNAALDSEASSAAINWYINTLQTAGPTGSEQNGFTECEQLFVTGQVAMWYDATSAADFLASPDQNPDYYQNVGYALPPYEASPDNRGNWLYSWAFGVPASAPNPEAAAAFSRWATSVLYYQTVSAVEGFGRAPTGARASTYEDPNYLEFAGDFAPTVLEAIQLANPNEPTLVEVPYQGGQFVRIPEFTTLGDEVSRIFAGAIAGNTPIDEAISQANELANSTAIDGGYQ
ncbi:MAG: Various polyols ABC transporter, substrate-binding protein [uncultured Thermomicrobiales bacterium]|uniref:Various polyols ABC transporter, substrate-binding protein n=1 Tax=uncultured Thermomicrobiales bacterium TaxID=1645740 RepID=A0A6J4UFK6_9BACT|nr:MAG: Various polyols ABC transporter, substrate-binding protein [uncultured Thermomicrobiales bacterium]